MTKRIIHKFMVKLSIFFRKAILTRLQYAWYMYYILFMLWLECLQLYYQLAVNFIDKIWPLRSNHMIFYLFRLFRKISSFVQELRATLNIFYMSYFVLYMVGIANWATTSHNSSVAPTLACLLYQIGTRVAHVSLRLI